jgi:hypothetical protein
VSFKADTTSTCGVSGNTVTLLNVGQCIVEADQAGNASYSPASPVTQSFQITQGTQTITFGPLSPKPLDASPISVSATASSGLAVSFAPTTPRTCGVSGSSVTLKAVGTCAIEATQAGNDNFAPATPVSQSFQITKDPQYIYFPAIPNSPSTRRLLRSRRPPPPD